MRLQSTPDLRKDQTLGNQISVEVEQLVEWNRGDPGTVDHWILFLNANLLSHGGVSHSALIECIGFVCIVCLCLSGLCLLFLVVSFSASLFWGRLFLLPCWKDDHLFLSYFKHGFIYSRSQRSSSSFFFTLLMQIEGWQEPSFKKQCFTFVYPLSRTIL